MEIFWVAANFFFGVIIVPNLSLYYFLGGGVISFRNNVIVKIMSLVTVLQKKSIRINMFLLAWCPVKGC